MSTRLALAPFAGLLGLAACNPAPQAPAPIDLRAAIGPDVLPVGVAVDPTGARYVFDEHSGLYRIGDDGAFEMVLGRGGMPDPGVPVRAPFTDLVAVGPERFAITALGDGFLLDAALHTMNPYFCYEPGGLPADYDQRTDAVAYDPAARLLYAQPRTFDASGNLLASQIASYSVETGADLEWVDVDSEVAAGGMAWVPGLGLMLGVNDDLCTFDGIALTETVGLEGLGVVQIDGLAYDSVADTLLVLDGVSDELFELNLADVLR